MTPRKFFRLIRVKILTLAIKNPIGRQ